MARLFRLAICMLCLCVAGPAFAQATRTWVSGVGDDVNPCSRTAPCKTFAGAISKTAVGGEINVLDSGGFGAVTITKSITIDGLGAMSSVLAANSNGIIVNGAGVVVTLRNLTINGAGTTTGNGIRILNAAAVNIENVVLENFGGTGTNGRCVDIVTTTANVRITVTHSQLYNCNNDAISSAPTAGNVILTVNGADIARSGSTGIALTAGTVATINGSMITNNTGAGVSAFQTSVTVHVSNSVLANNAFGIYSGLGGSPTTRLYSTVITGSTSSGLQINSGSVFTYGNNAIRGNAGNETPTPPSLGTQ
jgi:Right handed beta helix region